MSGKSVGWTLWLRWVLASTVGVAVVFALLFAVAMLVGALLGGEAEDKVPFVPFIGVALGIMQWLVLRRHVPRAGWWVLATTAGWLLGYGVLWTAVTVAETLALGSIEGEGLAIMFFLGAGTSIGILQWLVLQRHVPRAGWWVLASFAGWVAMGLIVGKSLDKLTDLVVIAVLPPVITGGLLVWLLQQARAAAPRLGHGAT